MIEIGGEGRSGRMLSKSIEKEMEVTYFKILCDFTSKVGVFEEGDEVSFGMFLGSHGYRLEAKVSLGGH
jgi:hypothetical protein